MSTHNPIEAITACQSIIDQMEAHKATVTALPDCGYVIGWTNNACFVLFDQFGKANSLACGLHCANVFPSTASASHVLRNCGGVSNGKNEPAQITPIADAKAAILANLDSTIELCMNQIEALSSYRY